MFQQQARILNTFFMMADAICVILAAYAAHFARATLIDRPFNMQSEVFIGSILLVMTVNNFAMSGQYMYGDRRPVLVSELLWPLFKAIVVDFAVLSTAIVLFRQVTYSRAFLIFFLGFTLVFIIIQRLLAHLYLRYKSKTGFNLHNILIVGSQERAKVVAEIFEKQLSWGHKVVGRLSLQMFPDQCQDCLGPVEKLGEILRKHQIDEVVFAVDGDKSIDLSRHLQTCRKMGIQLRILPSLWGKGEGTLSVEYLQRVPFLTINASNINASGLLYKRMLDIVGSLVGSFIFLLMYPLVAIAIKMDSPGPVLFKQKTRRPARPGVQSVQVQIDVQRRRGA
jgi:FlaA1/EpsC-like NDP-sugar epimerase